MMRGFLVGLLSLGLLACGGDDEDVSVADQPLQGQINGQAWTIGSATTNDFLSDEETIWVDAHLAPDVACNGFPGGSGESGLIINVPREVGTYTLGLSLNMTFVYKVDGESNNDVATNGVIIVEEITDTQITASLRATFDGDNTVEGRFVAELCGPR